MEINELCLMTKLSVMVIKWFWSIFFFLKFVQYMRKHDCNSNQPNSMFQWFKAQPNWRLYKKPKEGRGFLLTKELSNNYVYSTLFKYNFPPHRNRVHKLLWLLMQCCYLLLILFFFGVQKWDWRSNLRLHTYYSNSQH